MSDRAFAVLVIAATVGFIVATVLALAVAMWVGL